MAEKSRLRRSISRWANSSDMLARDMLKTYVEPGKDTIAEAEDRARVRLQGTLRTVTLRPRGGVCSATHRQHRTGHGAALLPA